MDAPHATLEGSVTYAMFDERRCRGDVAHGQYARAPELQVPGSALSQSASTAGAITLDRPSRDFVCCSVTRVGL